MAFVEGLQIGGYMLFSRRVDNRLSIRQTRDSITYLEETPGGVIHRVTQNPEGNIIDHEKIPGEDFNRKGLGKLRRFWFVPTKILWDPDPAFAVQNAHS